MHWACPVPTNKTDSLREIQTSCSIVNSYSVVSCVLSEVDIKMSGVNKTSVLGLGDYSSDAELQSVYLFTDYPVSLLTFASVCCIIFMCIGIPGNFITILALARYKKIHNATSIFIMNLSFSDLLFCCFNLPLAASTFWNRSWTHGKVLCRLFPMARYGLVAVSLFTVLLITINRYIMVSHPLLYPKIYKTRYIAIMIAAIWIMSFGFLTFTYFEQWGQFSLHLTTGSCTIVPDKAGGSPKQLIFLIAFALPTLVIIVCYARILWIVRKAAPKSATERSMRIKPLRNIEPTITEVPETSIPSLTDEVVQRRVSKTQFALPCFYSELSSSCNDSSTREDNDKKCAPQFDGGPPSSERSKRIRQSFVATFRRSTALIKPRLPTKKDKRLLTMIVAIITSFLICHLPITLTKTIFSDLTSHPSANIAGYVLIYVTTCINPIIYVVMSVEYRQAYKSLLKCR